MCQQLSKFHLGLPFLFFFFCNACLSCVIFQLFPCVRKLIGLEMHLHKNCCYCNTILFLWYSTQLFFWYCTISRNSCFSGNMMNRASICWSYPSTQMKHEMKQREPIIWQPFWQFYKNTVKWKAVAQFNINTITAIYQKQSLEGRITYSENTWEVNEKLLNGMCSLVSNMWCTQNGYSAIYKTMLVSCNTMFAWDKAYL